MVTKTMKVHHTPGPWQVRGVRTFDADAAVVCPDGRTFRIGELLNHPENAANARLISAAPELLAALKNYVAACREQDIKFGPITGEAEAAIAKAEGY